MEEEELLGTHRRKGMGTREEDALINHHGHFPLTDRRRIE